MRTVLIFIGIVMRTRSLFLNSIIDYMLAKQYSLRSVDTYLKWIAGFINYHDKRPPSSMGDNEVEKYLDYLVLKKTPCVRIVVTVEI